MSEARDLLRSLAGDDEWIRHSTLQRLREEGFDGDLERLKEALDDDADATRRNAARMALAALAAPGTPGADGALGVLLDALRSPHPDLRTLAAVAAGEAGNRAATPSLIERLDDTDINVAAAAAEALGALKDADAIEPLVDVARAADGFWLRSAAVAALGRIQDVRGLPGIRAASAVPELEAPVVEAVRAIGHPDALPVLEAMLAEAAPSSAGLEPLLAAGTILAAHPEVRAPDWVGTAARQVEPALRERLEREDDTAAARLLGLTGSEAALQYLLELIGPPRRSEAALSGVLAVQPERRADAILRRLSEAGTEECIALLSLLPPLEADGRIRQLVPLLDHEVAAVRAAAAESLARAPAERALPLLFRHLDRQAPVPEVVRAVGNMGSGICHALLPLLEDESSQVRRAAADALSRCASQDVAGRLEDALDRETDPAATEALLRAYGRAGGAAAVPRLARALDEVGEAARLAVLDGLGATRAGDALPYLEQAIGRGAAESVTALRALGEIGGPAAARVVERWLVAEDLDVRRAAAAAATAVPEALSEGVVEALPDDPDVWIRICAARILARRPGSRERLERMADHDTSSAVRDEARRALNREG